MLFGMRGIGHELILTSINIEGDVCIVFFFYRLTRVRISIHELTYMGYSKDRGIHWNWNEIRAEIKQAG